MAATPHSDVGVTRLGALVTQWLQGNPGKLELAAALKDFVGVLEAAPTNPASLPCTATGRVPRLERLARLVAAAKGELRNSILPELRRHIRGLLPSVQSPYFGGIPWERLDDQGDTKLCEQLSIAIMNPGRTGLLALGTQEVLWWRLWHVSQALTEEHVQICVLPGARWPLGARIPPGVPFQWIGVQTASWSSVGLLVSNDVVDLVQVVEDLGADNVMWITLCSSPGDDAPVSFVLGAIYPAPGGDIPTWNKITQDFLHLRTRFPGVKIVIAGDANIHLTGLLQHDDSCRCLHCRQVPNDRLIQAQLLRLGLFASNPPTPTHASGTCIDLFLTTAEDLPSRIQVLQEQVGLSDHSMVIANFSCSFRLVLSLSIGRVSWSHHDLWESALESMSQLLLESSTAAKAAREELEAASCMPAKRRRAILDAAAWIRETIVVVVGHSSSLVRAGVRGGTRMPAQETLRPPKPQDFDDYDSYKQAVKRFDGQLQDQVVRKYMQLRAQDPNSAKRFVSSHVAKSREFQIALSDEDTGHLMSTQAALSAIADDLSSRADNDFPQSQEAAAFFTGAVTALLRLQAPAAGVPGMPSPPAYNTASNKSLYSLGELDQVLSGLKARKQSTHGPLASVKVWCPAARQFLLDLMNLGRVARQTSTHWRLRQVSPLRKSGPKVVRKIANLRPISVATEMAAVQDGLWLGRTQVFFESFTTASQVGGKFDTMSVVLAVVLHIQLRHLQDLDTYVLFADLKQAYDTTDQSALLVSCYLAGIVEAEWCLLHDFFSMDVAVVTLHGAVSGALSLKAGIPQGRKFAVHAFTAFMKLLHNILQGMCSPAATVLPEFAADAISGLWAHLTPLPLAPLPTAPLTRLEAAQAVSNAWQLGASSCEVRRLAIHLLSQMPHHADRAQSMELLGSHHLGPLLFVDDVVASFASDEEVTRAVDAGLGEFASLVKSVF